MKPWSTIVVIAGCGGLNDAAPVAPPDESIVMDAMGLARPEPLIELVEGIREDVALEDGCPIVQLDLSADGDVQHEIWTGGCVQSDGTTIDGTLDLYDSRDSSWVAGDDFAVRGPAGLELYIDGAVELLEQGDLLLLDTAISWCGGSGPSCDADIVTLDLSHTIYPLGGYPTRYDVTVGGAVRAVDGLISIEGTWSIDTGLCEDEPASGTFAVSGAERHAIEMDGAQRCDSCSTWVVQGVEVMPFCGVNL